jgi:ribonuclease Z
VVVTHETGIKISYSGDTIPVKAFAKAAKNSTILIHEATFGDDLI